MPTFKFNTGDRAASLLANAPPKNDKISARAQTPRLPSLPQPDYGTLLLGANINGTVVYLRGFSHPSDKQSAMPLWTTSPHLALQITGYPPMAEAYIECLALAHNIVAYALPAWRETLRKTRTQIGMAEA